MKPSVKVAIIATVIFFISMSIGMFFFREQDISDEKMVEPEFIQTDLILPEIK